MKQARKQLSLKLKTAVLRRDHFRCQHCGAVGGPRVTLEVDHIYPRSKGGSNDFPNLQTLCRSCNQRKGATEIMEEVEDDQDQDQDERRPMNLPASDDAQDEDDEGKEFKE